MIRPRRRPSTGVPITHPVHSDLIVVFASRSERLGPLQKFTVTKKMINKSIDRPRDNSIVNYNWLIDRGRLFTDPTIDSDIGILSFVRMCRVYRPVTTDVDPIASNLNDI